MSEPVTRLNAALEGRYRVEREIGQGGMATVYLAADLRHRRKVALKVLSPELAAAVGAERFLAEIRTTANLQHPNILPLFDSGEADGLLYYVMPYVDGESLRHRLERERRLPVDEAVRIATDVAEALAAAHERGVIHRDVKPANILVSRGRALVADFGIARVVEASETTRLTRTGSSLGTTGYMSPEQGAGGDEFDHRADVYSLGCVLFEMLAGEPPYSGRTPLAVLTKQATGPVPSARKLRPELPSALERALATALAREPDDRFPSATAFAEALAARLEEPAAAAAMPERLVVVLPFVNRSGDADNEYFSDGLTEEVISDLAGLAGLSVISRNSAMALKGTTKDTPTLARELGVSHLVTGSVRRAGQALRVTAELVEARTDTQVWSEKFSGTADDVFGIQEEISRRIVSALQLKLTDTEERRVAERPVEDAVAYDCYLRARREMYVWTPAAQERALDLVDQAMAIVGEVPILLATVGQVHWNRVNSMVAAKEEGLALASRHVDRALAIDPECHLAVFVRGLVAGSRGRPEASLKDLYRARQLRPGDANVLAELCRYSNTSGLRNHWKYVEESTRIDPLTPITPLVVSSYRWTNGPLEEAAPPARRAIEMAPGASMLHVIAGWQIAEAGFRDEAAGILARACAEPGETAQSAHARFLAHALAGNEAEALSHITPETEEWITNEFAARSVADAYALLGRRDEALRWLRRAIDLGFINYPCLSELSVFLESLRSEPEFQRLMDEIRPRWEALVEWERGLA